MEQAKPETLKALFQESMKQNFLIRLIKKIKELFKAKEKSDLELYKEIAPEKFENNVRRFEKNG